MNDGILVKLADVECVTEETVVNIEGADCEPTPKYACVVDDEIAPTGRLLRPRPGVRRLQPVQQVSHIKKAAPAKVLMTEENLRGNPQLYVVQGRRRAAKRESRDYPPSDPPPQLHIATLEGHSSTPSMAPLFRLYGQSSLKQATLSLEEITSEETSKDVINAISVERVEEVVEGDGIVLEDDRQPIPVCDKICGDEVVGEGDEDATLDSSMERVDDVAMVTGVIQVERNQLVHNFQQWPLYWDRPIDFQEACDILTHQISVDPSKICDSVPQNYRGEGTFIIDLRGFANRHDVSLDGLGMWGKFFLFNFSCKPTGRTRFFGLNIAGKPIRIDDGKGKIPYGAEYEYKCMAKRYEHPRTVGHESKFIKKIFTAVHPPVRETAVALAVICYEWIGEPFDFRVNPEEVNLPSRRNTGIPPSDGSRSWEAASFNASNFDPNEACNAFYDLCPLYAVGAIDFGTAACIILGGTQIDISRICCRVPQGYRLSGTFVIDVRNFVTDAELRRDGNGAWGKPAGHSRYYKLDSVTGDAIRVDRGHKLIEGSEYDVQILSKRYEHTAVDGRFVRKIYTGRSKTGGRSVQCSNLAVITYYWKGEPEDFVATPQRKVRIGQQAYSTRHVQEMTAVSDDCALYYASEEDDTSCDGCADEQQPSTSTMWRPRPVRFVAGPQPARVVRSNQSTGSRVDQFAGATLDSLKTIERFSALLDRVEAFLDRLERAGDVFIEQVWMANAQVGDQQEVLLAEDGVLTESAATFGVNDGYVSAMGAHSS
uniref:Polyprotein n=1 Tax=Ascaris lumbricoides TaxID=6252 RepID=A0A0M3IJM0_ASCLU